MTPVAIFVRVSSDHQQYESQIAALQKVAAQRDWQVVETIAAKQSTDKQRKGKPQRDELDRLRELAHSGRISKVLIWGVSRISRNNFENHQLLNELNDLGISFYVHTYGMETILPNGKKNPMAYMLFLFFGELAENDNEERRLAIIRGQQYAKSAGKHIARPKGSGEEREVFLKKHPKVVRQLKEGGHSIREIAVICAVSDKTVQKVKKAMAAA